MLVDTNILIDAIADSNEWADWSAAQMRTQSKVHRLAINPVIYAELAPIFQTIEELETALSELEMPLLELPRPALFLASKAHALYRRKGGIKQSVLSDFFIGAHAAVSGQPILTRDTRRYASYFPDVELVSPKH